MKKLSTFDGHLVLWCKCHYSAENNVELLDELRRIWAIRCGLDFKHVDNYSFEYIANRMYKILVACEPRKEKYIHEIIHKELTSPIGYPDTYKPIEKLIYIYRSQIANLQICEVSFENKITLIDLPTPQPEIFKRITNGQGEYKDYDLIVKLDERNLEDCLVD